MRPGNNRFCRVFSGQRLAMLLFVCACLPVQAQEQQQGTVADAVEQPQAVTFDAVIQEAQQRKIEREKAAQEQAERDQQRLAELTRQRELLQQRLGELQSEEGIYSPALSELYSDLGALSTDLGDLDDAVEQYNQALQIARINTGLYSEQQIPLLHALIDSQLRREDWQKVDDLAHLSLHMHERLYSQQDPLYLAAAEDFGKWKLRMVTENLLNMGLQRRLDTARELSQFYARLLEVKSEQDEEGLLVTTQALSASWQLSLLEGKTEADLTLARAVASTPSSYFTPREPRYIYQTRCRYVLNAQGQRVRQCYEVRVENPRFRQSQRDAKRFELSRYTRELENNLDQMQALQEQGEGLSASERENLQQRIDELRSAAREVSRNSTRSLLNF